MVYDAPGPIQRVPLQELSARMSGDVIVAKGVGGHELEAALARSKVVVVCLVILASGLIVVADHRGLFRSLASALLVCLGLAACVAAGLLLFIPSTGVDSLVAGQAAIRRPNGLRIVETAEEFFGDLERAGNRAIVVDSRFLSDFLGGHFPGAIHIDRELDTQDRLNRLRGVDWADPIFVYCINDRCPFSDEVAQVLVEDGFEDVVVFRGGWEALQAARVGGLE